QRFLLGERKQWSEVVVEASREMALAALSLPGELQRFMDRALRGQLEIRLKNVDDNARMLYHAGQQLLWGVVGATATTLAVVFDGRGQPRAKMLATVAAAFCGVLLFFSWLAGRPGRRR
ncbi:MAG TPA: hypothetical protein VGL59_14755, partial [Polyangia bacterium]